MPSLGHKRKKNYVLRNRSCFKIQIVSQRLDQRGGDAAFRDADMMSVTSATDMQKNILQSINLRHTCTSKEIGRYGVGGKFALADVTIDFAVMASGYFRM